MSNPFAAAAQAAAGGASPIKCVNPNAAAAANKLAGVASNVPCPGAKEFLAELAKKVCSGEISPEEAMKQMGMG